MKKIGLVVSSVFSMGGEQRVTAVIANELAKEYEVTIFTKDTKEEIAKNPYQVSNAIKIVTYQDPHLNKVSRILRRILRDINERTGLWYQKKSVVKLLRYAYFPKKWRKEWIQMLSGEPFDWIIGVSGGNSIRLGLIADKLNAKTAGWEHNAYEAYFETPHKYFWHMDALFGESARAMDACVVLNDYIAGKYREAFDVSCKVIYNPRSFVSEKKSPLAQKTFITCGRFTYQKGYDLLLQSFKYFVEQNKEWKLVMVGDGEQKEELLQMVKDCGLSEYVEMPGRTDRVQDYLLDASIYLLSSRWEGFPMVVTEAFEMGLPVASYDITAVGPLITDGVQGRLAKAYDTRDFARIMLEMAENREALEQMAAKAVEMAETLSVEHIMVQWKNLLETEGKGVAV